MGPRCASQVATAFACAAVMLATTLIAQQEGAPTPAPEKVLAEGAIVYEDNCLQCHTDGKGNETFPALIGSESIKGPSEVIVRAILHGRQGKSERNGKKLLGVMPPQAYLSDEEIAAAVAYVRKKFGGIDEVVAPDSVKAIRNAGPAKE
jgi:mono/diheme cytochrome c family protein